jgi:hypothetical protein
MVLKAPLGSGADCVLGAESSRKGLSTLQEIKRRDETPGILSFCRGASPDVEPCPSESLGGEPRELRLPLGIPAGKFHNAPDILSLMLAPGPENLSAA